MQQVTELSRSSRRAVMKPSQEFTFVEVLIRCQVSLAKSSDLAQDFC